MTKTGPHTSVDSLPEITATTLKNRFSEVIRHASEGPVAISRHNRREFVILTAEQFESLQQSRLTMLENLTAEFDRLVETMNTPEDRAARQKFFSHSGQK